MFKLKLDRSTLAVVVFVIIEQVFKKIGAEDVKIGYLHDDLNEDQHLAFQYGMELVNKNQILHPDRLLYIKENVKSENVFQTSQTCCSLLTTSVVAVFGPNRNHEDSMETSKYVQSLCDSKEIPHIEIRDNVADGNRRDSCTINLYPHQETLSKAFSDLIEAWTWKDFVILYESDYSLVKLKGILENAGKQRKVYLKKLTGQTASFNYRKILAEVKRTGAKNFLIDCRTENLYDVLRQMQQVGLMTGEQQIICMNLDLHTIDLSPFKYSGTNITGVRLIDCESKTLEWIGRKWQETKTDAYDRYWCSLRADHALIVDSIMLFSMALKEFGKHRKFDAKPLSCNTTDNWEHGYSIINYMKMKTLNGLTGKIKLDNRGLRTDFILDIIELTEEGLRKVGDWNSTSGLRISRKISPQKTDDSTLNNKTLIVIICLTEPYGMLKEDSNKLIGNDRFEGLGIDLIHELSQMLGFRYVFRVQEDGANGALNRETGKWDGMINEVLENKADLAITDLTITSERESAVDFTHPFMNLGISILYKKPEKLSPSFFSFTSPFSKEVWFLLGASFFGVSLMLFLMGRLCPAEWRNPNPCIQNPEYLLNQFSLRNSFWFTMASLMQQGSEIAPTAISTRMVAGLWWFFTLIMVSTYQANLAASLTVETRYMSFSDINGLVEKIEKGEIIAGAKAGGATANFFRDSNDPVYQKVWKYMDSHPNAMTANNSRGVERANKKNYAFFMESTTIEFTTQRQCNLTQVGKLLDDKGYGIAMRQNSSYRNLLSTAIVLLHETGKLQALKTKWWNEKRVGIPCSAKMESKVAPALNLQNLGGVFLVLAIGTLVAFAFVFVESALHVIKESVIHKLPLKEELRKEFEFIFNFRGMVKRVRKRERSVCINEINDYKPLPYTRYATSDL